MYNDTYNEFFTGQPVEAVSDGSILMAGIITKLASNHAEVTGYDGNVADVNYGILREASLDKTAQRNRIKEEEKDGKKFVLDKDEKNVDGKMSVRYKVTVDGKEIWTSEELITNVYDNEFGWSAPDDFDEGKLALIQKTAESGFDLIVESFKNIMELAAPGAAAPSADGAPAPEGKPAFAPGTKGEGGAGAGGMGGGGSGGSPSPEGSPETTGVEGETVSDTGVPVEETEKAAPEIPAEAETAEPVATAASLTFSRRIVSDKKKAAVSSNVTGTIIFELEGQEYEFDYTATLHYQEDVRNDVVVLEPTGGIEGDDLMKHNKVLTEYEDAIRESALEDAYSKMAQGSKKVVGILALAKGDQRLHNNPEHRLNPVLRDEMKRRNIDSGNTNDLELADKLKDFDWSKKGSKKMASGSYDVDSEDFLETTLDEDDSKVSDKEDTCPACGSGDVDFSGEGIHQDSFVYYPMTCNQCRKTSKAWYDS